MRMAEYKQIHKVEVEKKPFKLTKKMIALLVIAISFSKAFASL